MARELTAALRRLDADRSVGAVVLSGGEEAFCAGAHRAVLAAAGEEDEAARADLRSVIALGMVYYVILGPKHEARNHGEPDSVELDPSRRYPAATAQSRESGQEVGRIHGT